MESEEENAVRRSLMNSARTVLMDGRVAQEAVRNSGRGYLSHPMQQAECKQRKPSHDSVAPTVH